MTRSQVSALLQLASAFDGRRVTEEVIDSWHPVVGDLDYELARWAVQEHYRGSGKWVMPADIRLLVDARDKPRTMSPDTSDATYRGGPMPDRIRALLEERWGPREGWLAERPKGFRKGTRIPPDGSMDRRAPRDSKGGPRPLCEDLRAWNRDNPSSKRKG